MAKSNLADKASIYGANNKEYQKAANEVKELERQFEEARKNVNQRVDSDYREAVNKEQMLAKEMAKEKDEYDKLNSHSFQYQPTEKPGGKRQDAVRRDWKNAFRRSGINAGFQNNSIRIADFARPPDAPVFPRTQLFLY